MDKDSNNQDPDTLNPGPINMRIGKLRPSTVNRNGQRRKIAARQKNADLYKKALAFKSEANDL